MMCDVMRVFMGIIREGYVVRSIRKVKDVV